MCGHSTRTFRLAVALFSDAEPLVGVLSELWALGCTVECLCLIGHEMALNSGFWHRGLGPDLQCFRRLFLNVEEPRGLFEQAGCRASSGPLLDDLGAPAVEATGEVSGYALWLSKLQQRRLVRHIEDGGLVLIVSSATPEEQDASSRILLRHSQHGVHTHDFTLRRAVPARTTGIEGGAT